MIKRSIYAAVTGMASGLAAPALAASNGADWITPVSDGVTTLTSSIVSIAGAVIGLCIVCFGLWAAMRQRIEWATFWVFFVAGLFITVGPAAITWFIDLMQKKA